MLQVLNIVSGSWQIAIMFIASLAGGLALYALRWLKQSSREDKAYRASQAVTVRKDY